MAKKQETAFVCTDCGADFSRWLGQCSVCKEWNTVKEVRLGTTRPTGRGTGYSGKRSTVQLLSEVDRSTAQRLPTGIAEFDRVLGQGIVCGSVVLIGGAPGAGKSTLLLQALANSAATGIPVLYVSGEESPQQIAGRADRLGLPADNIKMLAETSVEEICKVMDQEKPQIVVIDSIQVVHSQASESAPGSISQVRESAAALTQYAKESNTSIFMVGHVTKDQSLAGPMTLSHIVDAQVVLSSTDDARYRILRADKNRFGSVGELGFFAMTDKGLKEVKNPSAMFLSRSTAPASGSVVTVIWEGTRPLLVEIQALVTESQSGNPRRLAVGMDQNRIAMLLAVLAKHGGLITAGDEVYVNVVGGIRIYETSSDLAAMMGIVSSLQDRIIPRDSLYFGEIGLNGEIRPVANGEARLKEAAKHGFRRAVIPKANAPQKPVKGLEIVAVESLMEALEALY
ncbi:MAG: DNA repair protein RadA [Desulfocapsa sp.]|nr:DNA repair protein RadA [Desulfocapsa sp.]